VVLAAFAAPAAQQAVALALQVRAASQERSATAGRAATAEPGTQTRSGPRRKVVTVAQAVPRQTESAARVAPVGLPPLHRAPARATPLVETVEPVALQPWAPEVQAAWAARATRQHLACRTRRVAMAESAALLRQVVREAEEVTP
jgi:hypothetical protein